MVELSPPPTVKTAHAMERLTADGISALRRTEVCHSPACKKSIAVL